MRESETREVLLDKLIGIQDIEAAKRIEEMDADLISECSEYVIELTGEELPSESALEQMKLRLLQRLFGRNGSVLKYRKGMLRKLVIAAIIVILIVAISVSMMPLGTNDESLVSRWGYFLLHQKAGYQKNFENCLTLIREGQTIEFKSKRQFAQKTGLDVLVPTVLPDGFELKRIYMFYDTLRDCTVISFATNNPLIVSIGVDIGIEEQDLNQREHTEQIGGYFCAFTTTSMNCHCNFNYNGNGYHIDAESYEDVILILNNMKGSFEK